MIEFIHKLLSNQLVQAALTIVSAVIIYFTITLIVRKIILGPLKKDKNGSKRKQRGKTYVSAINSIVRYAVAIIALLMILQIFGVDISSLIAGLGVVGIIVGFALKDSLSDIVMGKNILTDNFFNVGDVILFQDTGTEGKVVKIGLKRTQVKDLNNDDIVTISNRNIENIQVRGDFYDTILPTPYEKTTAEIQPVIDDIISQLKALNGISDATCRGIRQLNTSSVDYTIRVFCKADARFSLKYDINRILKDTMDQHGIAIPYAQQDVHLVK